MAEGIEANSGGGAPTVFISYASQDAADRRRSRHASCQVDSYHIASDGRGVRVTL